MKEAKRSRKNGTFYDMVNACDHYRELVLNFVRRDIKARYTGTLIGLSWSIIHPVMIFFVYLLVFGFFLNVRVPTSTSVLDFALYFSAGYFPWIFFSGAITRAATCIVDNRNYIKKIAFPREIFPVVVILSEGISLLISMFFVALLAVYVHGFSFLLFILPAVIILEIIFVISLAFLVAAATVFFRGIPQVLSSVFTVWFWATPIAYTADMIPKKLDLLVFLNPMHHILALYRSVLSNGAMPNVNVLLIFCLFSLILFCTSLLIFKKGKLYFSDML